MFRFLAFDLAARGEPPTTAYEEAMARLGALKAAGRPREETNRAFYRNFAGRRAAELAVTGAAWFEGELARGGLFRTEVLDALRAHSRRGDLTVLVSGSFPPCLEPVRRYAGADLLVCSRPQIAAGRYTGVLVDPVIGAEKARALRRIADTHGVCLARSTAYGDHTSDLPLLEAVGHPVVVGEDPALGRLAEVRGWRRLCRGSENNGGNNGGNKETAESTANGPDLRSL
jgi:HAD superfamily hydrolase (TIGR01490 family)